MSYISTSAPPVTSSLRVTLQDVMDNLKLVCSYLGMEREENPAGYARIAALDSDAALIALLMEDAALLISARFPGPLLRWRYSRNALEFTFESTPDTEALQPALTRVICLEVLRRWLRISGSDYADSISESAAEATDSLKIYFPGTSDSAGAGGHPLRPASPRRVPPI